MMVTNAIAAITAIISPTPHPLSPHTAPNTSLKMSTTTATTNDSDNSNDDTPNGIATATHRGGKGIICAGLSCLDLQLLGCTRSGSDEAIERYDRAVHCAGGSSSMTGTTLALLLREDKPIAGNRSNEASDGGEGSSDDDGEEKVRILTKIGPDHAGNTLLEFYRKAGASTELILVDSEVQTSMAVLPVFRNGKRGCFVNLACNDGFSAEELLGRLNHHCNLNGGCVSPPRAFLFGYPHLMPKMQGDNLRSMLEQVRRTYSKDIENDNETISNSDVNTNNKNNRHHRVLIGVDLNGVDGSDVDAARAALFPALSAIDILHLNEDEAKVLSSSSLHQDDEDEASSKGRTETKNGHDESSPIAAPIQSQLRSLHQKGCAIILLSLGSQGSYISITPDPNRLKQLSHSSSCASRWTPGMQVRVPAYTIGHGEVNANGAGDALFAGFCLVVSSWGGDAVRRLCAKRGGNDVNAWELTPEVAGTFASLVAWQRCDARTRDGEGMRSAFDLMDMMKKGDLPEILK
mmetsp:Transcript_16680/g.33763  ORF Transcript_16680/g.33763 Transcript_16680/m.33763 type:complete len:519 (-) Transcript_16680:97-1653(-)